MNPNAMLNYAVRAADAYFAYQAVKEHIGDRAEVQKDLDRIREIYSQPSLSEQDHAELAAINSKYADLRRSDVESY